jgi:2-polyprenyl-3-methyl-5-hydroxy-6-metoxy-1,4-benzoquinol methylase
MCSNAAPGFGAQVEGVEAVRRKNFNAICAFIKQYFPDSSTILDVGCSRGIFLDVASKSGFNPTGLEPDAQLAASCRAKGFEVFDGSFPNAAALSGRLYDIIIFNDSFEHIPNPQMTIDGVKKHLHPAHGIVIINIPTSDGFMFQSALRLMKLGIHAPFDRLWQKGFASPHLHCFNKRNLCMLFEKSGFTTRRVAPLPFYTVKGLWKRISCRSPFCLSLISWFALTLLYPLFLIRSDCFAAYFSVGSKIPVSQSNMGEL